MDWILGLQQTMYMLCHRAIALLWYSVYIFVSLQNISFSKLKQPPLNHADRKTHVPQCASVLADKLKLFNILCTQNSSLLHNVFHQLPLAGQHQDKLALKCLCIFMRTFYIKNHKVMWESGELNLRWKNWKKPKLTHSFPQLKPDSPSLDGCLISLL